jgi:RHS repeat-associated protein
VNLASPQGYEFIYGYTSRSQLDNVKLDPALFGGQYNTPLVRYTYDHSGNRTTRTVLSGAHADYDIDELNRVRTQTSYFANGQTGRFDYGFDAMGRRRYEQRDLGTADGFQYDPSDELTNYRRDGTLNGDGTVNASLLNTTGLQYDNNGNRTQVNAGLNGIVTYVPNSLNQYDSVSNIGTLGYDGKGNLTVVAGWTYFYDAQNRLTMIQGAGMTISMTYDPLNRVITRNVNGAVYQNVWEGWNLIEEHRPDWSLQRCYLYGANQNEMVASFDGNVYGTHWYWQDGRGNTSHITGDDAALFERYTYDLSGAPRFYDPNGGQLTASSYDTRFLFAGSQYLPDTGLYDMRNRSYHIGLNRFLQTDPIGFKGDALNLYRYCGNDDVDRSDPMGLLATATTLWRMSCFFDSGNSSQEEYNEFMGNNKPSSGMPSGNWNDPNIKNHIKTDQTNPGVTIYTNNNVEGGVVKPTLDWWVRSGFEDKKVVLGELEHVSRYLWSSEKGDLAAAIRSFNANPNGPYAKEKLENARLVEKNWQNRTLHGRPNRHAMDKNPELGKQMSPAESRKIESIKPLEDPRPEYLGY